jgi:hypothetical protein
MQDSLQDAPASHDSPLLARESVSPITNTNIDDTDDDTHKEEEEYAKVIKDFLHCHKGMMKIIQFKDCHKQNYTKVVMSTPCQHYFCYSICKPNMVGVTQASMLYSSE